MITELALYLLSRHNGKDRAISKGKLAQRFNVTERRMRELVSEVANKPLIIGTLDYLFLIARDNNGIYIADNEEAEKKILNKDVRAILNAVAIYKEHLRRSTIKNQLTLDLTDQEKDIIKDIVGD